MWTAGRGALSAVRGSGSAGSRGFSSGWKVASPADAHKATTAGTGVVVDLRATTDGIQLPGSVHIPFSHFLSSGASEAAAGKSVSRDEMVEALPVEALKSTEYHQYGERMLSKAREVLKNPALTHDGAKDYLRNRLKALKENPKAYAEKVAARLAGDKSAPGKKMASEIDEIAKSLRPELTPMQEQYLARLEEVTKKYLAYNAKATKAELGARLSTEELTASYNRVVASKATKAAADARVDAALLKNVPRDKDVYLLDFAGVHARGVADRLESEAFKSLFVVEGGLDNWVCSGLPVELAPKQSQQLADRITSRMRGEPTGVNEVHES